MKLKLIIFTFLANVSIIASLTLFIGGGILIFSGYEPIRPHLFTLIVIIFLLYVIPEHFSNRLVEKLGIGDKNSLYNNSFTIFFKYTNYCHLCKMRERRKRLKQIRAERKLRAQRARMHQIILAKRKLRAQLAGRDLKGVG